MIDIPRPEDDEKPALDNPAALFQCEKERTGDLRLIARALRQGWAIPDEVFQLLPADVMAIVTNRQTKKRDKLKAIEVLMKMHDSNIRANPLPLQVQHSGTVELTLEQKRAEALDIIRDLRERKANAAQASPDAG